MEHIHIAALRPNLDALESKQIKAAVTLIWPYSSSQRQFALLLAEPDLRLRRNKGQVRARFSSTSARALATTGVGIGDEVVLSLHGAQFVQDGAVSTPGRSLDWELAYTQTVAISVRRKGIEIANLELIDAAPTPAPRSPVKQPAAAPSPVPQWSSPAFLKRARLSSGPVLEQPAYDPLADESNDRHDKKRRRKSYRDWKAWTYTARTPSPEKEHVGTEDELDDAMSSPSRPPQLPKTPVSPTRTEPVSITAGPTDDSDFIEETTIADSAEGDTTVDDGELQKVAVPLSTSPERPTKAPMRDSVYHDLSARPNEDGSLGSEYDFGGDTELNTDDEMADVRNEGGSTTELATELEDEHEQTGDEPDAVASELIPEAEQRGVDDSVGAIEGDSLSEVTEAEDTTIDETMPELAEPPKVVIDSLAITMPPPSLPELHTDFAVSLATAMLTPVGREPSSPTLKAVDSATLPLPSPFPGEQASSYMDHVSVQLEHAPLDGPVAENKEAEPGSDADYIMENSFFSSISSSKAGGLHQDHETAFTPVRFTFGMDGAGWSRPLELSSPPPEDVHTDAAADQLGTSDQNSEFLGTNSPIPFILPEQPQRNNEEPHSSLVDTVEEEVANAPRALSETAALEHDNEQSVVETPAARIADNNPKPSHMIVLSSDVESDRSEDEDEAMIEPLEEQSSEENIEPEREDELTAESDGEQSSDDEAESEDDQLDDQQALPASSQVQEEPDLTVSSEMEVENEQIQSQEDDAPTSTQASAAVSAVVDLGSPSADERSDDSGSSTAATRKSIQVDKDAVDARSEQGADDAVDLPRNAPTVETQEQSLATTIPDHFDDFTAMDVVQEPAIVVSSSPVRYVRESPSVAVPDTYEEPPSLAFDVWKPQLGMEEPLPFIEELGPLPSQDEPEHADVKMESVEDGSLDLISQPETQDVPQESVLDPATNILVGIPENGHNLRERQFKSVPATAPARNTRSKAKSAVSPPEEGAPVSRLSASMRSTVSKGSVDSTNDAAVSPPRTSTRTRSTVTPTRDPTQTSPYSLRSQSKLLSPDKSMAISQATPVRRSPRNLVRRDSDFDIVASQVESRDLFGGTFEPSQELGFGYSQASQGRYSGVGVVKDSEEDPSHSEGSMSTVQYSDDGNNDGVQAYTNLSDSVKATEAEHGTPHLKPPPANLSQTQRQTRSRSRSMGKQSTVISPSQPPQSPRRSLRSARSTFSASPSPRIARTTKSQTRVSSPVRASDEEPVDKVTPNLNQESVIYPVLPGEGGLRSSPPAPTPVQDISHRSSPVTELPSAQQPTVQQSNLITPDDTQQTAVEPPLSFQARQPDESLLMTPELTQSTSASASLRSFDIPLPGVQTQPAPQSPTTRTSPRRKPPIANLAYSSPIRQSSSAVSASDEDATPATKPDLPSVGLSTPLAYYTPLRDLIYFLNRSSQFHSSANPDVLALCTTASQTPERAKARPRHWSTTLHITDLSTFPAITTVSIFRAYQTALPVVEAGDVVLLRAFKVESRRREPVLKSAEESSWCVWRFGKTVWGAKKGKFGELRAREEVKGPVVERGEGEWTEVERLRGWYMGNVKAQLEAKGDERMETRGESKDVKVQVEEVEDEE